MKILTAISILQIAAILLLYGKLADIEQSLERPVNAAPAATVISSTPMSRQDPVQHAAGIDEERLRYIIRDELRTELGQLSRGESAVATAPAPAPRDPVESERQREQVFQQIEYYSSVGRISDAEMVKLQTDIARLDPAARTQALGALNRAMNSGQLEGRL